MSRARLPGRLAWRRVAAVAMDVRVTANFNDFEGGLGGAVYVYIHILFLWNGAIFLILVVVTLVTVIYCEILQLLVLYNPIRAFVEPVADVVTKST